jgi:hypothetical protein
MTDVPDYIAGARALLAATTSDCTIDGAPAVVIRIAELNDLVARVHQAEAAARTTPDNPPTSGDAADNPAPYRVCTACPSCDHTLLPDGTCEWCPAEAAPATADDGLLHSAISRLKELVEWRTAEVLRLTELTAQYADRAIANGKRAEQATAAIARVRAVQPYTARTHGDRSQGYLLGWNAAREAAHAALEAQEADRA